MRFNEFKIVEPSSSSDGSDLSKYVLVQKRDSLSKIAKALKISLADLVAANPQIKDPDLIYPGDKINVPGNTTPNPVYPEIPRGRPGNKLKTPKDDGSFDKVEKNRLGNYPATEPDMGGHVGPTIAAAQGTDPSNPLNKAPANDSDDGGAGAGRGKINPGPLGKGKYIIKDYTTTAKIFYFFKNNNFNDVQAAAITANAYVEGLYQGVEFNPKAKGDIIKLTGTPTAFGIFQWRLTRAAGLYTFAKRKGKPWTDLDLQLAWAKHELENKYSDVVTSLNSGKNTTDIASATQTFMRKYENPSFDPAMNHIEKRIGYANTILDAFGTKQDKTPAK